MLIRKLHIQNFRRFEDLKVSFEDDLTVLVARNGQGKSSILDAITVLLGPFVGPVPAVSGVELSVNGA